MQPASESPRIRVLILDDHTLFRRGLVRLLDAESDLKVVGDCETTADALRAVNTGGVDVVLLDFDLGAERGSDFAAVVKEQAKSVRILVVTAGVSDRQALDLIQQGVAGIFMKAEPPETLVTAIRKVHRGDAWLNQSHLRLLVGGLAEPSEQDQKQLSARERAVLRAVVEGRANKEIAGDLQISESSVKAALQQLFNKTGVRTRSQLVRVALDRYRELVV